jgi:hypothetical protein
MPAAVLGWPDSVGWMSLKFTQAGSFGTICEAAQGLSFHLQVAAPPSLPCGVRPRR